MTSTQAPPGSRKEVFAWSLYDWASSAHSTLLITFVLHYMQTVVFAGRETLGATVYAMGIGLAMLLAAVLSPIVGALADVNRSKRRWLLGTAFTGSGAAILMAILPVGWTWPIVVAFVVMNLMADLALVPYNGFLPEISDERTVNRVSAYGFALGYLGGSLPLLAAALLARWAGTNGAIDELTQHRAGLLLLGLWWAGFSLPVVMVLRDRGEAPAARIPIRQAARMALNKVGHTLGHVRRYRVLAWFLLAFLLYNDGVATIFTQANTLAVQEFKFSLVQVSWLILVIQWVALPSALAVGWLADWIGQKATILGCLAVWIGVSLAAIFVTTQAQFWMLGIAVALVLGGTQSVSRAAMGTMTPPARSGEFFGFFNVSGRAASFAGPVVFGAITAATGDPRWAAVALLPFFVAGGAIVLLLDFAAGRRAAVEESIT